MRLALLVDHEPLRNPHPEGGESPDHRYNRRYRPGAAGKTRFAGITGKVCQGEAIDAIFAAGDLTQLTGVSLVLDDACGSPSMPCTTCSRHRRASHRPARG